jgi:hypothetical protein
MIMEIAPAPRASIYSIKNAFVRHKKQKRHETHPNKIARLRISCVNNLLAVARGGGRMLGGLRFDAARLAAVVVTALILSGCVRIPAPDDLATGPKIDELVQRVKCDLYEAVKDRLNQPYGYEWLHSWTAQANLNYIVNDQSGIAPGALFTEPHNIVSIAGRVANFAQSWSLGLGAQENNTATRNETMAFTVSLEELKEEFGSPAHHNCEFPEYIDLQSELGLRDWISASLSPVDNHSLNVGYHKTPKTGAGASTVKAAISNALAESHLIEGAQGFECTDSKQPAVNKTPPKHLAKPPALARALCDLFDVLAYDFAQLDGGQVREIAKTVSDIQEAIRDRLSSGPADKVTKALENTAIELTAFLDPPIDMITHQVQFIIVWNASATPSWTLVKFKGPGPASGSLLSVTSTKTHTLNVVLGPPSSIDAQGAINALQVGTAVTNALNSGAH